MRELVINPSICACPVLLLHLAISSATLAQTISVATENTAASATATPSSSAVPRSDSLDEIVVTANKREQSLNDVGASVSAFSADVLDTLRINNVSDLAKIVPGLETTTTTRGAPVYTLRGVGFYDDSLAAKPDVSIYLDQVPLDLSVMSALTQFDLERVEVLKGPQGTLFGNNATGGAINFVAAKPSNTFTAGVAAGYGTFNTAEFSGYISGPIKDDDSIRVRFAAKSTIADGWQQSYTRSDTNGSKSQFAARFLVDWDATESLKFEFNLNGWIDKSQPEANQYVEYLPNVPVMGQPLASYPLSPQSNTAADWQPGIPHADNQLGQISVRADWDFFHDLTLTSLSAYTHMHYDEGLSPAGVNLSIFTLPDNVALIETITQELRVANAASHRFRWVFGGNYDHTQTSEADTSIYPQQSVAIVDGFSGAASGSDLVSKTFAVFTNEEYDLLQGLVMKGGIRYTREETNGFFFDRAIPGYEDPGTFGNAAFVDSPAYIGVNGAPGYPGEGTTNFINYLGHLLYPTTWTSVCASCNFIFDNGHSDPTGYRSSERESNVAFSVGVNYKPEEDLLLYANISKGYKAGGFATLAAATTRALAPVKQESLLAYEAGFKSTIVKDRLTINGSAFYYDYTNKQELEVIVDPLFNQLSALVNIPKSRIYGAELEIAARPLDGLTVSLSTTYLNSEVKNYVGAVGSKQGSGNLGFVPIDTQEAGARLAFTPTWSQLGRFEYDHPINADYFGFIGGDVTYQSSATSLIIPPSLPAGVDASQSPSRALYTINGHALMGANLGLAGADGRWRLAIWGKNLANKYFWSNVIRTEDTVVRVPGGVPRQFGATFSYKFR